MEQTLMDKLTILADSAKYDVACTSSGASRTARPGTVGSCYAPGCCHAFTADGRCVSLLKVLMTNCCSFDCGYCVNRRSNDIPPRHLCAPGAGRADHGVLPPQLHRGSVFVQCGAGHPGLHHRADAGGAAAAAGRIPLWGLYPRQGYSGHKPGTFAAAGVSGRPSERERGTAQRAQPEPAGPRQGAALHLPSHEADRGVRRCQPGRAYPLPPRAQVCPRRAEHPDDRGCFAGDGLPHLKTDRGDVPEVRAETGVLLCLHPGSRGHPPARAGHKAAPSAGAPAVSGRLAAAVLPVRSGRNFR